MKKWIAVLALPLLLLLMLPAAAASEVEEPQIHIHTVESWAVAEEGHAGICTECQQTLTQAHEMDAGVVTTQPTCKAEGVKTYTCTACGMTQEEILPALTEHICETWTADGENHVGVCLFCEEALIQGHVYDAGQQTLAPTCQAEGVMTYTCQFCSHSKEETIAMEEHAMDNGVVTTQPTCQAEGVKTYTCVTCSTTREESLPQLPDHVVEVWTEEENGHSGTCIYCNAPLQQDHAYDSGVVTTEPTCKAEGLMTFTCLCGKQTTEVLPILPDHVGENWVVEEESHTGSCKFCGEVITGAHQFDEGVVTTEPTCQAEGVKTFTCVCGHSYTQAVSALTEHVAENWIAEETAHVGNCKFCGEAMSQSHSYDEGVVTTEPTCQAEGIMTFTCLCGHSYTQVLPMLLDHVYGEYTAEDAQHSQSCIYCGNILVAQHEWDEGVETLVPTCTTEGIMTYQCTACGHSRTEVIAVTEHPYGDWVKVDNTYHKHTCVCGKEEKVKHNWGQGEITTEPTCSKVGVRTYTCSDCAATKTADVTKLKHTYDHDCDVSCNVCGAIRRTQHNYQTQWTSDETMHWHECTVCGDDGDLEEHIPDAWIIDMPEGEYTDGQQHRNCATCGRHLETQVIPATGCLHGNEELLNIKAPSCIEEGYTGDWTCPRCFVVVVPGEVIPMLPHNTQLENAKEPTCTEEGYTGDVICQDCLGTITQGEDIEMLPHNTQRQNMAEATCTELGYTGDIICLDCLGTITAGEIIEMLPHNTQLEHAKVPSCAEEGYTGDEICQACLGTITAGEVIPMLPHNTQLQKVAEPSCTKEGYTGDVICVDCLATITAGEVIEMLPHQTDLYNWISATCIEAGYSGDYICNVCLHIVEAGVEIPAKGHRYENGYCLACRLADPDYVPPTTQTEEVSEPMSPMIILCIAALGVTFVGTIVVVVLMVKKK